MMRNNKVYLNESQLRDILKNAVHECLMEAKSIKSDKLQSIFNQHGGLPKSIYLKNRHTNNYVSTDIHNMKDDDILAVITKEQLNDLTRGHDVDHWRWSDNFGLDHWAKSNGVQLDRGDRVDSLELADGTYLIYVERNAEFERSGREGGFKDYFNKKEKRRVDYNKRDGFQPMSNKAKAARDLRKNPYFWQGKRGELKNTESGWNDPRRRKEAIDNARIGKDAWGYDAIDHYKKK